MELIFTKGSLKHDLMKVVRDDGQCEVIECPKQRIIPHDMVHYAVEVTLRKRGFLARVLAGERAAFTMRPEAESDAVERLVEVLQGDAWSGGNSSGAAMIDLYRVTCDARACPMFPVVVEDIDAVRQAMADLTRQWNALPVGESLHLMM